MAYQRSGEVLRGDELVQVDFGYESERFGCSVLVQEWRVPPGDVRIDDGSVGVIVAAGCIVLMMRPLISLMLMIRSKRGAGVRCGSDRGNAGHGMVVVAELFDKMSTVYDNVG